MTARFLLSVCCGALVALVPACSAIVAPDPSRLGGSDAGVVVRIDADGIDAAGIDAPSDRDVGPRPDGGTDCFGGCDDGVACTVDSCMIGMCRHLPDDATCGAGMRCVATGCVALGCGSDADCDDGDACNGTERCTPGGPGADPTTGCADGDPLGCDDTVDCTIDDCAPATGCTHVADDAACDDGFDCSTESCSATGCTAVLDDASCNGGCFSGATCVAGVGCSGGAAMSCPTDGNPCTSDPTTCDVATGTCLHPPRDGDMDGHTIARATGTSGTVTCPGGTDCNDADAAVNPGATEVCNGRDDDCDGTADDGIVCGGGAADDCASAVAIPLTSSGAGLSGRVTGSTAAQDNDYRATSCSDTGGRDSVYYVDIPNPGTIGGAVDVVVSTVHAATMFDTVVAVQNGGTCGAWSGPCNDDVSSGDNRSTVRTCVMFSLGGARLYLLVDGYNGTASGNFEMTVTVTPRAGGSCM